MDRTDQQLSPVSRNKKRITAAAVTMTEIVFQLSLAVWPEWVKGHTVITYVLGILAATCWLWVLVDRISNRDEPNPHALLPATPIPSQPAHLIENRLENVGSPTINLSVNSNSPVVTQKIDPPEPKPVPTLLFEKPEVVIVAKQFTRFSAQPGGDAYHVVWVTNPSAAVGQRGVPADRIYATLSLQSESGISAYSSHAYWLNEEMRTIKLGVGERRAIVIGKIASDSLVYYENDRTVPFRFRRGMTMPTIKSRTDLPIRKYVDVEIRIISAATSHTVAQERIRITKLDEIFSLSETLQ